LNANSSANYDVDILHLKSLHNQLKICNLLQYCLTNKDGIDTICLKWSNPKTNVAGKSKLDKKNKLTELTILTFNF
jgi:hypothetical protein